MKNPRRAPVQNPLETLAERIIEREGGYSHHPRDKGGPTKYGITQATLARHLGRKATAADVAKLSREKARSIYVQEYISPFAFIQDPRLLDLVADTAVQHGPPDAIKFLQRAIGAEPDGHVGQQTLDAVSQMNPEEAYERVLALRHEKYARLSERYPEFANGWQKRIQEFM